MEVSPQESHMRMTTVYVHITIEMMEGEKETESKQ